MIYRIKILQLSASLVIVHTHLKPEELQRFPVTFVSSVHRFTKLFSLLVMLSFDSWLNGIYSNLGDKPSMKAFPKKINCLALSSTLLSKARKDQGKSSLSEWACPFQCSGLCYGLSTSHFPGNPGFFFFQCQVEVSGHPGLQTKQLLDSQPL